MNLRQSLGWAKPPILSNAYVDVHCWKFTGESLVINLVALGFPPESTRIRVCNFGDEFALAFAFSPEAHSAFEVL
jgi:hypothetical protein